MDGLASQAPPEGRLEATLRRDRWIAAVGLFLIVAAAWLYLWRAAVSMDGMDMSGMSMSDAPQAWGLGTFILTFVMWTIMMVGMMLPSTAPTILLYGSLVRRNGERGTVLPGVWVFTSGYLAVWTAFSVVCTLLQFGLEQAALLTPMMMSASKPLSAVILIAAGIYQWLPIKEAALRRCQNPLRFLVARWHPGVAGAFRMGAELGLHCLACCALLMLLLFVAGIMSLLWIALIAGFVLLEKLLPAGRFTSDLAGLALLISGIVVLIRG